MATPNERDKEVALNIRNLFGIKSGNEATNIIAAYREEIEARASEPAEERGPEVGDIVGFVSEEFGDIRTFVWAKSNYADSKYTILMRRAEVESRIKEATK